MRVRSQISRVLWIKVDVTLWIPTNSSCRVHGRTEASFIGTCFEKTIRSIVFLRWISISLIDWLQRSRGAYLRFSPRSSFLLNLFYLSWSNLTGLCDQVFQSTHSSRSGQFNWYCNRFTIFVRFLLLFLPPSPIMSRNSWPLLWRCILSLLISWRAEGRFFIRSGCSSEPIVIDQIFFSKVSSLYLLVWEHHVVFDELAWIVAVIVCQNIYWFWIWRLAEIKEDWLANLLLALNWLPFW